MGSVVKRSLSFPADVFEALEEEARREGVAVSTIVAEATREWLLIRRGVRAVAEWEAEHGAFTAAEIAEADRTLDELERR